MNFLQRAGAAARLLFGTALRGVDYFGMVLGMRAGAFRLWNYSIASQEGYQANWAVYAALHQIVSAFNNIRPVIILNREVVPDDEVPANLAPLLKLLDHPNRQMSRAEFQEIMLLRAFCGGISYSRMINVGAETIALSGGREFTRTKTQPKLYNLRPDLVRMQISDDGLEVINYEYYPPMGGKQTLQPEELITFRFVHPDFDCGGLSPLQACGNVIESHTASVDWNRNLMQNSGVPAGVLSIKNLASKSKEERERVSDQFQEKFAGTRNAGKTFVTEAEISDYKLLAAAPKDIDWAGGQGVLTRAICAVLNVAPQLLGDPDSKTYANTAEARKALYTDNAIPLYEHWINELNYCLVPLFNVPGLQLGFTTDHIEALSEDETEIVKRQAMRGWWTVNELRAADRLEPIAEGDVLYKPAPLPLAQGDGQPPPQEGKSLPFAERERPHYTPYNRAKWHPVVKAAVKPELDRYTSALVDAAWSHGVLQDYQHYLDNTRSSKRDAKADAAKMAALLGPVTQHLRCELDLRQQYREMFRDASRWAFNFPGLIEPTKRDSKSTVDLEWNLDSQEVKDAITARQNLISGAGEEAFQNVSDTLRKSVFELGGSPVSPDVLDSIRAAVEGKTLAQAETIARTETLGITMKAAVTVYAGNEVDGLQWVYSQSGYERHMSMDGQTVKVGESFVTDTGEELEYPGDPNASAGESCNCECDVIPLIASAIPEDEANTGD